MAKQNTPSVRDLYDTFIADYEQRTGQQTPLLARAFVRAFAWPVAGVVVLVYRYGQWVYRQMFIATCDVTALRLFGFRAGVDFKDGSATTLKIQLEGVTAPTISAGTLFVSESGVTYKTTDVSVTSGTTNVCIATSTTSGSATVPAIGATMTLVNPLLNVPDSGTVSEVTTEGDEPETLEQYRARVQARYRLQPQGGAPADYFLWATEVDGIVDAYVYVVEPGITTVYPVGDGSGTDRNPSTADLNTVETYLRQSPDSSVFDRHPVQATLNVTAPGNNDYSVDISIRVPGRLSPWPRRAEKSSGF
jgi:uncharacterized phage protein gp47/JayE